MFTWEKLGQIYDPGRHARHPQLKQFGQSPSALVLEDRIRVYFCARPEPDANGQYVSHATYLELDRDDPKTIININEGGPILELGGYGAFDEFGTYPISVARHADEVWAYYAGITRCESVPFNAAIGLAISRDEGLSFTRAGAGPVLCYDPDEPFLLGSPRIRRFDGRWYLWYVAGRRWLAGDSRPEPVYKIRTASSDDGVNWKKHGRDLLADVLGPNECQACADVTFRSGRYHMFYSYREALNYKSGEGGYRIGYAYSDDMLTWIRRDDLAGLQRSSEGWDSEMVNYPNLFTVGDDIYLLYQGNGMGRTGFGLARLAGTGDWGF
ncbi:glycosylase [Rhizobium leguminosarum]|uniref:glycosylase n=1 Tax=Rhizobium leguminosarum TaxID=384 RepID=UPI0010307639|nr:glycosylase [Rhizobium leguminosarum]TAV47915.1 glycosylase [Rhizobium leguminosarum]TAV57495.1 glycosylase [Rhizobium leguminosarum]TAV68434.1 glycosylase [Rhizobium leguminosarum]TAY66120.1 glycosylase [Rhizobium leguminosarum]